MNIAIIILPQFLQESLQKSPNFPVVFVTQFDKGFTEKSIEQESASVNELQSKRLQGTPSEKTLPGCQSSGNLSRQVVAFNATKTTLFLIINIFGSLG